MSVEWYIQSFYNGEEQALPTQKIMSILADYRTQKCDKYIDVFLPDGDVTIYMDCLADSVSGIMISRPVMSKFLVKIVYDVMRCGNCVLYTTNGMFPIILSSEILLQLSGDMLESIGEPRVAVSLESFSFLLKEMHGI